MLKEIYKNLELQYLEPEKIFNELKNKKQAFFSNEEYTFGVYIPITKDTIFKIADAYNYYNLNVNNIEHNLLNSDDYNFFKTKKDTFISFLDAIIKTTEHFKELFTYKDIKSYKDVIFKMQLINEQPLILITKSILDKDNIKYVLAPAF